jgi:hypothetical protein
MSASVSNPPASPRTPIALLPRYTGTQPSYPTRSRTLQSLIESPPALGRGRRSYSVDNGRSSPDLEDGLVARQRRMSSGAAALQTPEMRSMRLIGRSQSKRYNWEEYLKSPEELAAIKNKKMFVVFLPPVHSTTLSICNLVENTTNAITS